ncbi:putative integral membrane protein [Acanthocheilonema viteae]
MICRWAVRLSSAFYVVDILFLMNHLTLLYDCAVTTVSTYRTVVVLVIVVVVIIVDFIKRTLLQPPSQFPLIFRSKGRVLN